MATVTPFTDIAVINILVSFVITSIHTLQTMMRVEFHPASNMMKHGKWRFYGMPIDNIELV